MTLSSHRNLLISFRQAGLMSAFNQSFRGVVKGAPNRVYYLTILRKTCRFPTCEAMSHLSKDPVIQWEDLHQEYPRRICQTRAYTPRALVQRTRYVLQSRVSLRILSTTMKGAQGYSAQIRTRVRIALQVHYLVDPSQTNRVG